MDGPSTIEARMRADLPGAMKARDQVAVTALRTALAAIANAEAPPAVSSGWVEPVLGEQHEHPRLVLTEADVRAVVHREIAARRATISELASAGASVHAEVASLQAQSDLLESYLS
jgi:uncharacterized protein YqeY